SIVPRPPDGGPHIGLANFVFWEQGAGFDPPDDLAAFLAAGKPPVYVGFGSSVVPDPAALTRIVFEALARAGMRGVVSRGWGELGTGSLPDHVHVIDDCPHDWLFPRRAPPPRLRVRGPPGRRGPARRGAARGASARRRALLRRSVLLGPDHRRRGGRAACHPRRRADGRAPCRGPGGLHAPRHARAR